MGMQKMKLVCNYSTQCTPQNSNERRGMCKPFIFYDTKKFPHIWTTCGGRMAYCIPYLGVDKQK
jgi:hypothetical protein